MIYVPVSSCESYLAEARNHYGEVEGVPGWFSTIRPRLDEKVDSNQKYAIQVQALRFLQQLILKPLEEAAAADPQDVQPCLELATWLEQKWRVASNEGALQKALNEISQAQRIDPDSTEGFLAEYRLQETLARLDKPRAREHYTNAAKALRAVVDRDPTEARMRYRFAEILFLVDDPVRAREQARRALELDERASEPSRQLEPEQQRQILKWLGPKQSDGG
jgi:tetratricopeptide (TPR) repeat protein